MLLLPVWVYAVYGLPDPLNRAWALGVLVLLGVSDVVDGALARRFGLATELGAALDAIADKLAQVLVITALTLAPREGWYVVPGWFLVLLVTRDLVMVVGLVWIRRRRARWQVEHRTHGKIMSLAIFALMLAVHLPPAPWQPPMVAAVALVVGVSASLYSWAGIAVLREPLAPELPPEG